MTTWGVLKAYAVFLPSDFSQQWLLDRQDILREQQADLKHRAGGKESKGGGENQMIDIVATPVSSEPLGRWHTTI